MSVRRAKVKDINKIQDLLLQVCMVHHKGRPDIFKEGGSKYSKDELIKILEDEERPIFVAVDEMDEVLGYAFCIFQQHKLHSVLTDIRTLYIDDLCVDEGKRGKGIGRTLYDAVLAFAKEQKCYNVTLNVWSLNENALKFYQACGMLPQKIGMEILL